MKSVRRTFTLIEMMIVFALISVIAVVVGVNIQQLLAEQRFKTSAASLLDRFQMAQQLMIILDSDVKVQISKDRDGIWKAIVSVEKNLSGAMKEALEKNPELTNVQSIGFFDPNGRLIDDEILIQFSSLTQTISRGVLVLSAYDTIDEEGPLRRMITFTGIPRPLQLSERAEVNRSEQEYFIESDELYPAKVREERILQGEEAPVPTS